MKKALYVSFLTVLLSSACQRNEEPKVSECTVAIMARIGKTIPQARYQQVLDATAMANFASGDRIGVYMDDGEAVCWTLDKTSWSSESTVYWADKENSHTFCAYYPYSETGLAGKERVKMPALGSQDGSWGNIPQHDFLVATKKLSYNEASGVVSFTGDNAFKHVSSLLKINIKADGDMSEATINKITLGGNGLIAQGYYSFETESVTLSEDSENSLSISPEHSMDSQDVSYYFILNEIGTPIDFALEYTSNNKEFIAQREALFSSLLPGRIHEYNIVVKGGNVIIEGGSISGWTPGDGIEDIIINGEEVKSINR